MDVKQKMREILEAESKAVAQIPVTDGYEQAVELIVERVHRGGAKLVTSGMGKCGQIADNIATTFSSTGIPAIFLHPSEAQHGDLGVVQPHDVLLVRPELDNSSSTSWGCTTPKSPCCASLGCRNTAGMPVEEKVVAMLSAIWPHLPMPEVTSLPPSFFTCSTMRFTACS